MDRIPKPSEDNPFAGFINMCRDYDNKGIEIYSTDRSKSVLIVGSGGSGGSSNNFTPN